MKRELIFSIILSTILLCEPIFAYDQDIAHPERRKIAIDPANSNLPGYLVGNLGFIDDVKTKFTNKDTNKTFTILRWLQEGSKDEDSPPCRATNHFHNPLRPLSCFRAYVPVDGKEIENESFNRFPFCIGDLRGHSDRVCGGMGDLP